LASEAIGFQPDFAYNQKNNKLPFLDIGCGAGEFIQFLNTQGISEIGIDSDTNEIILAKNLGLDIYRVYAINYIKIK
jgi:O-antigen chain-terminating methyltransferase